MPVILHFVLMVIIGCYAVQWLLGVAAEFVALSALAFAAPLASCELSVNRTKLTRFLFGVKA